MHFTLEDSYTEMIDHSSEQRSWLFTGVSWICAAVSIALSISLLSFGVTVYEALYPDVGLVRFLVIALLSFELLIVGVAIAVRPLRSLWLRSGSLWTLVASSLAHWVAAYLVGDMIFIFWILGLRRFVS